MESDTGQERCNGRFAVVIPVFNHGGTAAEVARSALELGWPVYVVDDGSTDEGGRALQAVAGIHLLRHAVNRGKGAALMTGFEAAAGSADWAITLDADGQHQPQDALALVRAIAPGLRPIVIGRRLRMQTEGAPWTSRFGRGFSNFWVRTAGGPKITDSQSGFRIYPLPEVLHLGVKARRYQFEVEVLVKAAWSRMAVIEAPVRVIYPSKAERISHFRPFVDFVRNSNVFTRLIVQRLLCIHGLPPRRREHG
jgi:glycosyltransferase involved in cell wall biosynthesis